MRNHPQQPNNGIISLRDVFRILFRHKVKAVVVASLIFTLTIVGLILAPRSYVSESKIFVRIGRESVSLDPATTAGQTVSVHESRETEIQSVMDLLKSESILEMVVDRIGERAILQQSLEPDQADEKPGWGIVSWARSAVGSLFPSDNTTAREEAIHKLEKWVYVASQKKSSVITIVCRCGDPALAQKIVSEFVDSYKSEHARVNRTAGSAQFLEKQVAILQQRLDDATERLRDAKNRVGLVSLDSQKKILELQITNLNQDIVSAQSTLTEAEARLESLSEYTPDLDRLEQSGGGSVLSMTAADEMRDRLYELQIRERELMSKYQPAHPELQAVRQQAEEAQRILNGQEVMIERSKVHSLRARLNSLHKKLLEADQKLIELNQNEVVIGELARDVEMLTENYRNYKSSLEVARYDAALLTSQITNINVVQPATYVSEAVSPKKTVVLGLGLIVAFFGGLGISLLGELLDSSFTTAEQIEAQLDVPVLVSIPNIERHRVLLN